ncbi:MAG: 50S ribosomal protein L5 [Rickettsiaceae bacterium]
MLVNFKELYSTKVRDELKKEFSYNNVHNIPKLVKIVINMGVGEAALNSKVIDSAMSDLTLISGQKPMITRAKRSEAAFKIREGMKIGCKVTLRKDRMYDFLERLVMIALPRVKGFRGLNAKSFDERGNFNFGVKEQIVFPEIEYDKVDSIRGMDITIVTTAKNKIEAKKLLSSFSLPFYN